MSTVVAGVEPLGAADGTALVGGQWLASRRVHRQRVAAAVDGGAVGAADLEQGDGLGRAAVIFQRAEVGLLLRDIEEVGSGPAEGDGQAAEQVVRAGRREGASDVGAAAGGVDVDDGVVQGGRAGPNVEAAASTEAADLVVRDGGVDGRERADREDAAAVADARVAGHGAVGQAEQAGAEVGDAAARARRRPSEIVLVVISRMPELAALPPVVAAPSVSVDWVIVAGALTVEEVAARTRVRRVLGDGRVAHRQLGQVLDAAAVVLRGDIELERRGRETEDALVPDAAAELRRGVAIH